MIRWRRRAREVQPPPRDEAASDAWIVDVVRRIGRLVPQSHRSWDGIVVVITALLVAISWPTLFATHDVPRSLAPAVAAITVLPLLLIRTSPLAAWGLTMVAAVGVGAGFRPLPDFDFPWQPTHLLVILASLVAVTLTCRWKQVLGAWLATTLAAVVFMPLDLKAGWAFAITMITVSAVLVRGLLSSRRQLARQEEVSETERSRRALLEERSRIARDLHDVVAHRMSMVVVQAQTASRRLDGVPPHVEQELDAIGAQAREALNEVRGMLGVLRSDGQLAEDAPQPGLGDVERLMAASRAAGVDLSWSVTGDPAGCSDAAGMVVYRILQESLANATRHAPGSRVDVGIEYVEDAVRLSVLSGPTGSDTPSSTRGEHGAGAGIAGMVARARSIGGELTAEPTTEGGFSVRATVPKQATGDGATPPRGGPTTQSRHGQ